jgi:hypothetical protein
MAKKISVLVLCFFSFCSIASADYYQASTNINVRAGAHVTSARIGYFKKGQIVNIQKILGNWCKVQFKNYSNAYAYCPLFKKVDSNLKYKTFNAEDYTLKYLSEWSVKSSDNYATFRSYPRSFSLKGAVLEVHNLDLAADFIGQEKFKDQNITTNFGYKFNLSFFKSVPIENETLSQDSKNSILIIAQKEQGDPLNPAYLVFRYNKVDYPQGEQIFETILNSLHSTNN